MSKGERRVIGCLTVAAIAIIVLIAGALSQPIKPTASSAPAVVSTSQSPAATTPAASPTPSPATTDMVAYTCTGDAPDGLNITYGAEGSNAQATSLPFSYSEPLSSGADFYNVTAQLDGSGDVSCTTTVTSGGESVTKSGTASGGYNIAEAEVCSDFTGGYDPC